MRTFIIESRVTRIETIEIMAHNRKEALNKAEDKTFANNWEETHPEERQLVSIS